MALKITMPEGSCRCPTSYFRGDEPTCQSENDSSSDIDDHLHLQTKTKENFSRTSWFLTMTADFVCARTGLDWFDRLHSLPSIYGIPLRTYAHVMHVDFQFTSNAVKFCVRAWNKRDVRERHANPR